MGKISKKEVNYFEMFATGVAISLEAAKKLKAAFADGVINEDELRQIKELEHQGDKHVHASLRTIEEAFITPIDRSDLIDVLKGIENITDSLEDIANHIYMMNITRSNDYLMRFVDLVVLSCEKLHDLMKTLNHYKKNSEAVLNLVIEVNRLEEVGDTTFQESMSYLFTNETNPVTIITHQEMYKLMEHSLDCCEDVADMVERIMIAAV